MRNWRSLSSVAGWGGLIAAAVFTMPLLVWPAATPLGASAAPVASQAATLPAQTSPVGTLTVSPVVISPPLEQIPRNWGPLSAPEWYVAAADARQLEAYLADAGLAPADVRTIRETARPAEEGGMVVRPPADLLLRLAPDVRAKLYVPLMRDERNRVQFEAYRYAGDTVEEWLGRALISVDTRRLVEPLVYRHEGFLYFADIDLIRSQIEDGELQRLVKGLLRHSTVMLQLSVDDQTRLQDIIEYWGRGGRRTDVRPLIESIAETGAAIDISHLLPGLAREHLYRYPKVTAADLDRPALNNCFWTALNFFSREPDDGYLELDYAVSHLKTDYYVVHNDLQLGDVVAFLDDDYDVFHVAVYLADGYIFSKNGFSSLAPWSILPIEQLKGHYFQFAENWRLSFHRRKDM